MNNITGINQKSNQIEELQSGLYTAFIDADSNTNLAYKPEFVKNSYRDGQKVISILEEELSSCNAFAISVAFITKSGITPLLQLLKELEIKGIPGRILTTDYLMFSEPEALKTLSGLSNITLRMYQTDERTGFHTKGYIFQTDGLYRILIGSANMTQYAMTINQEWNAKIISTKQGEFAQKVCTEFEHLWHSKRSLDFELFYDNYLTKYETVRKQRQVIREQRMIWQRLFRAFPYRIKESSMLSMQGKHLKQMRHMPYLRSTL